MRKLYLFILLNVLISLTVSAMQNDLNRYRDSLTRVMRSIHNDDDRLKMLSREAFDHQYIPNSRVIGFAFFNEGVRQNNAKAISDGAYYIAGYYDRMHDSDSLELWVKKLKSYAETIKNYDGYLERKAALSRALASKRFYTKAVLVAQEVKNEAEKYGSTNGYIAACNSLGCVYAVTDSRAKSFVLFMDAYNRFDKDTNPFLRLDILSRITSSYLGLKGKDRLYEQYLKEMKTAYDDIVRESPSSYKSWAPFLIDYELKQSSLLALQGKLDEALECIHAANKAYGYWVDPVFWVNIQLYELQFYARNGQQAKSIELIDKITPRIIRDHAYTFEPMMAFKMAIQHEIGDSAGALNTIKYMVATSDSIKLSNATRQMQELRDIYHVSDLSKERDEIVSQGYRRMVVISVILLVVLILFYVYTRYSSDKLEKMGVEIERVAKIAQDNSLAKERLCMEISHDVRTPLNAVIGFAELLADSGDLDAETKMEYENVIQSNSAELLEYINNVLELSRLEARKIKYDNHVYTMRDMMKVCRMQLKLLALDENEFEVKSELSLDMKIIADLKWLELMIRNVFADSSHILLRSQLSADKNFYELKIYGSSLTVNSETDVDSGKRLTIRNELNKALFSAAGGLYTIEEEAGERYILGLWPVPTDELLAETPLSDTVFAE